jgi:hypothetical protein
MRCCQDCDTSGTCRIPEEISRLKRIHTVIHKQGGNPWLEARIEQYIGLDICLSALFGLENLHAKAVDAEAALLDASVGTHSSYHHAPHQSVALEITLHRHLAEAAYAA